MSDGPLPPDLVPAWERYFALHPDPRACPAAAHETLYADGLLFPLQRRREQAAMLALAAARKPAVVAEAGCDKGASLAMWCMLRSVKRAIGCEVRGTPYARLFGRAFPGVEFLWLPHSSRAPVTLGAAAYWLGEGRIDCLFLDGDKTRFAEDFDAWLPLMAPGGVVFMHDVQDREPKAAFAAIKERGHRTETILDLSESHEAVQRQRGGIPPATAHEGWVRHWAGGSAGVGVIYLDGRARP